MIGSQRSESQSEKVGLYIKQEIEAMGLGTKVITYNLGVDKLPFWDQRFWDKESKEYKSFSGRWKSILKNLENADSFVIITPERSGMATPAVKNFMLFCGPKQMANKPALLIGVSSGTGGRYPIAELRMSSYKNTQLNYIPQHIIVDHVGSVLNKNMADNDEKRHDYISRRINHSLGILSEYSKALTHVRNSGVVNLDEYPHGM